MACRKSLVCRMSAKGYAGDTSLNKHLSLSLLKFQIWSVHAIVYFVVLAGLVRMIGKNRRQVVATMGHI